VEKLHRAASTFAGQILLEAWLGGGAESTAIEAECNDPVEIAAVSASLGKSCSGMDACTCTTSYDHSLYNYTYTQAHETKRETEADVAHVDPTLAAALLGMPLTGIPLLASSERSRGFKCSTPDATVPSEAALVAALGPLPGGQSYYLPYSPLSGTSGDWRTLDDEAFAFADNLHDVRAFLTRGDRDLVVPTLALAPALRAALGSGRVLAPSPSRLGLRYPDGDRFIDVFEYLSAGHMITMIEPEKLSHDIEGWLTDAAR